MSINPLTVQYRCGAPTNTGHPCRNRVDKPDDVCLKHSGVMLPASQWADKLPANLQDAFLSAIDAPDVFSTRKELALCDALMTDLIEELEESDGNLSIYAQSPQAGKKRGKTGDLEEADLLVTKPRAKWQIRDEMRKTAALKSRLTDSFTKRMRAAGAFYTVAEMRIWLGQIANIIIQAPISEAARKEILEKIEKLRREKATQLNAEEARDQL